MTEREQMESAPREEILEAYIHHMRMEWPFNEYTRNMWESALRTGFAIAQPDGHDRVAPIWWREWKAEKERVNGNED